MHLTVGNDDDSHVSESELSVISGYIIALEDIVEHIMSIAREWESHLDEIDNDSFSYRVHAMPSSCTQTWKTKVLTFLGISWSICCLCPLAGKK